MARTFTVGLPEELIGECERVTEEIAPGIPMSRRLRYLIALQLNVPAEKARDLLINELPRSGRPKRRNSVAA
jgi:hypothetical protein